ncbi:MAG: HAMP domain-containing sensor histidine kinase, partial [Planctomycetota bacterium]
DDGTFLGFAGVAVDDTVRRRAQRQVEELNRRLSLALDASAVGVWDWRVDTGRLVWDERSLALYGLEPNEFSERFSAWTAYVTEPDRGPLVDALHAASADGSSVDVAFTIQRGDGAVRTIQAIGDAVAGSDGRVVRMIGVQRDVTEMLQTQRELERSNEELAQFAYRTSHDLKGPLVSIRRLAEFASEDLREERPDDVLRGLSMIEERVDALGSKVRGILDAARADLADTPDEPVAVARLVDDVLALHAPLAGERPVELTAQLDGQTHPHLPRGRLEQILSNLVANGVRYASPERELSFVRVRVSCGPRAIELSVEDNGAGLPDQDPDAPYQMFRRFHSDRSGSGLGLFIVKKHVDAMGGTITHRSSAAGTVFELVLPLAVEGVPC